MAKEDMHYPLHLGVTEAGDGEDGRIKSAIGIGSLLLDGLGDTVRVSLTEDSVYEIPVARAIADKAMSLWTQGRDGPLDRPSEAAHSASAPYPPFDSIDPYHFTRRETTTLALSPRCTVGPEQPPRVIVRVPSVAALPEAAKQLALPRLADTPAEGLLVRLDTTDEVTALIAAAVSLSSEFLVLEVGPAIQPTDLTPALCSEGGRIMLLRKFEADEAEALTAFAAVARDNGHFLAIEIALGDFAALESALRQLGDASLVFTLSTMEQAPGVGHATGAYRRLAEHLRALGLRAPIWIRNTKGTAVKSDQSFLSKLLDASFLTGGLLCDGLGSFVSIETESDVTRATRLTYNVLQGAGARISKTEFVACPSCGRTLFDLQTTTQRIRTRTGHLKGVKIAIMGCIVNGPGEMADADFGYVGGAPGKINLYVGKSCVRYNIPEAEADEKLVALIKEHGKWFEPGPQHTAEV